MKEIARGAGTALKTAGSWFFGIMLGLFLVSVLTVFMGDTNDAALAALVIVIGGEIVLRRRKKKKSEKFGEVARGSEIADHTKEGQ